MAEIQRDLRGVDVFWRDDIERWEDRDIIEEELGLRMGGRDIVELDGLARVHNMEARTYEKVLSMRNDMRPVFRPRSQGGIDRAR